MNVMITGASGLYGLNMIYKMIDSGEYGKIIGIDNFVRQYIGKPPVLDIDHPDFVFLNQDFRDIKKEQIDELSIDTVIHFAAHISVPESMESRIMSDRYVDNNELGTYSFMQELLKTKNKPLLVYASSGKVYGKADRIRIDESQPLNPNNLYGMTKLAGEKHCMTMHNAYGYPVIIIRNFNTYGPNQNLWKDAAVIANFIKKALLGEQIIIHGDGMQSRDFQYVEDACNAYMLICNKGKELSGNVYNLGTGKETTIRELAETIIDVTGSNSKIIYENVRDADRGRMKADFTKLREATGYHPMHTLEEGLLKSIDWYEKALVIKREVNMR